MKMDDFDRGLIEVFSQTPKYNEQGHEDMLQEVSRMYQTKTRRAKYFTWASLVLATGLILLCFWLLSRTDDIKTMLFLAVLILIFHEGTVLMKLWWWTYSSRNLTLETLKEIQLQLCKMEAANKGPDRDPPPTGIDN